MIIYASGWLLSIADFVMVISVIAVLRLGRKDGLVAEFFKLIGVLLTIFITLHFYVRLAVFLRTHTFAKDAVTDIFAFCLLGLSLFFAFVLITKGWDLILKIRSFDIVDRWGHTVLSLVRCYFICSMIFLSLLITENGFFVKQAKYSLSWHVFRMPAVAFYKATYDSFVVKLFPGEKINKRVFALVEDESPRKVIKQ